MHESRGNNIHYEENLSPEQRRELERGLRFANVMLQENQEENVHGMARVNALAQLLLDKGLITLEELNDALNQAAERVLQVDRPTIRLYDIGDKYAEGEAVDVDCQSLLPLCRARCCTLKFWLSKQDLDEGAAQWDYGNPYWIKQGSDGYCVHLERGTGGCTIHAQRPHVCRKYDCRNDERIWLDFEQRIPAPFIPGRGNADVAMQRVRSQETR